MAKLYRSRTDSKLFGLCGGLAQVINVDSTLLRVIVIVTAFFSGFTVIPLYFIACLVIPKEPAFDFPDSQPHGPYYGPQPGQPSNYYGNPPANTGSPYSNAGASGHSTGFQPGRSPQQGQAYPAQQPPQQTGFNPGPGQPPFNPAPAQPPFTAPMPQGFGPGTSSGQSGPSREATVDEMMRDMEKKMLQREIDELRAKVAQYEQKNRQQGDGEQS